MNYLKHQLYLGKFINRWVVSKTTEQLRQFTPMTMTGEVNQWLKEGFSIHDNPCRAEFVMERRLKDICGIPVSEVSLSNDYHLYFPFENVNVENSGFWFVPTYLKTNAFTCLESEEDKLETFEIRTCGGTTVFINGKKIIDFTPYTRNLEKSTTFQADIKKGINEIMIIFDDLAERDTQYFFRLDYMGNSNINIALPIFDNDEKQINAVENILDNAYFEKDTVRNGNIILKIKNDFTEDFNFKILASTEDFINNNCFVEKYVTLKKGDEQIDLGDCEQFFIGTNYFKMETVIGGKKGLEISKKIILQVYPENLIPKDCDNINKRKKDVIKFISFHSASDINKAYAILKTDMSRVDYAEELILKQLEGIDKRKDCSDFYLILVYRIWEEFKSTNIFKQTTWQKMKETILNFRYWIDEPGDDVMWFFSENHALLFHSCQLASGQIFPDEIFTNSGLKGTQLVEKSKKLLEHWFSRFSVEGLTEWNSVAYFPIDVLGLCHLYELSKDETIKENAKKALDHIFYYISVNSIDGILDCSCGRSYEKELKGNLCNGVSCLSKISWNVGAYNASSKAPLALCTTSYNPPYEYKNNIILEPEEELIFNNNQGFERHVDLYMYKTKYYTLNSAINFKTNQKGYQEHMCQLYFSEDANVWVNHPGETTTQGGGRPSYWAGNGYIPEIFQYKGLAYINYNIGEDHTVDFTHMYFPSFAFDEFKQEGKFIFFKKGSAYGYAYANNGLDFVDKGLNKDREIKSYGKKNFWIIRAADKVEFKTFDDFIAHSLNTKIITCDSEIKIEEKNYGDFLVKEKKLYVNKNEINFEGYSNLGEIVKRNRLQYTFDNENLDKLITKVSNKMQKLENDGFSEKFPVGLIDINLWEWPQGVGLYGLYKLYLESKDKNILKFLTKWFDERIIEGLPEKNVNTMSPMLTMVGVYEETKNEKYLELIEEFSTWVMNDMIKTGDGAFQHMITGDENEGQILIDTLFMTCLFLTRASVVLNKKDYLEEAKKQFLIHIKYLYNKKSRLFYHGYDFDYNNNYGKVHWARGNAWYTCCLPDFLEMVELEDSIKNYLLDTFKSQVVALKKLQDSCGLWHTVLDDSTSYLETSATAGFGYGILKAVRKGYIDKKYKKVGLRALFGVINNIDEEGIVLNVSYGTPVGNDAQFYKDIQICPMTYGQALAILILTEAKKI